MTNHWDGRQFLVAVPTERHPFYRLVTSGLPGVEQFRPDREVRKRYGFEDQCVYQGASLWETWEQAGEHGRDLNEKRRERGKDEFTHVAEVEMRPRLRHACAWVGPIEGHHILWAAPEELSRISDIRPIEET